MITVFVGDNSQYLADKAKEYDQSSYLVDYNNYKDFLLNCKSATIYTSLADLPDATSHQIVLYDILLKADKIFYYPPEKWNDENEKLNYIFGQQYFMETILVNINNVYHTVQNLNLSNDNKYNKLEDFRKTNNPQIWVSGCSISIGVGVSDDERYGNLVQDHFNIPVSYLSRVGMSIEWSADQILRSDIRKGDLLIWGIPHEYRNPVWDDEKGEIIDYKKYSSQDIETIMYRNVTSIECVLNVCKKLGVNVIILVIQQTDRILSMMPNIDEYVMEKINMSTWLDLGTDNAHPGPKQHRSWANLLIKKINDEQYFR